MSDCNSNFLGVYNCVEIWPKETAITPSSIPSSEIVTKQWKSITLRFEEDHRYVALDF